MPARVDLKYGQGFFLTEENLVKLDDFVRRRLGGFPEFKMQYQVTRADMQSFSMISHPRWFPRKTQHATL